MRLDASGKVNLVIDEAGAIYLDVVRREGTPSPVSPPYSLAMSGEYAMVKAAAAGGS